MKKYKVGDLVRTKYPARTVFVTERAEDIKEPGSGYTDKPGFGGIEMTGSKKGRPTWGYDKEIGAVFHASAKDAAEAKKLQENYGGYGSKKHARRKKVEKIVEGSVSTTMWIVGGLGALWLYSRWKKSQPPIVSGLPLYQGPSLPGR